MREIVNQSPVRFSPLLSREKVLSVATTLLALVLIFSRLPTWHIVAAFSFIALTFIPQVARPLAPHRLFLLVVLSPLFFRFGDGWLVTLALALAPQLTERDSRFQWGILPLVLVFLVSGFAQFSSSAELRLLQNPNWLSGLIEFQRACQNFAPPFLWSLQKAIYWLLAAQIAGAVFQKSSGYVLQRRSILVVLFVVMVGLGAQTLAPVLLPHYHFLPQDNFWTAQGRQSGVFADPNAAGLFAFLTLGLAASLVPVLSLHGVVLWLGFTVSGLASGSRSFFLGIVLTAVVLLLRKQKYAGRVVGTLFAILMLLGAAHLLGIIPGVTRIIDSLDPRKLEESLRSRTIFWHIALTVWKEFPLFGIGIGNFATWVYPYSQSLGHEIGLWSDNPNSFYLGLLAEGGLCAGLCFLWSVRSFQFSVHVSLVSKTFVGVFFALLVLGPHLDFGIIVLLFGLMLGTTLQPRRTITSTPTPTFVLALGALAVAHSLLPAGTFLFERDSTGEFQWTKSHAVVWRTCEKNFVSIDLATPRPVELYPVTVELTTDREKRTVVLTTADRRVVTLACGWGEGSGQKQKTRVTLRTTPAWIPSSTLTGVSDHRTLGAQVYLQGVAD